MSGHNCSRVTTLAEENTHPWTQRSGSATARARQCLCQLKRTVQVGPPLSEVEKLLLARVNDVAEDNRRRTILSARIKKRNRESTTEEINRQAKNAHILGYENIPFFSIISK